MNGYKLYGPGASDDHLGARHHEGRGEHLEASTARAVLENTIGDSTLHDNNNNNPMEEDDADTVDSQFNQHIIIQTPTQTPIHTVTQPPRHINSDDAGSVVELPDDACYNVNSQVGENNPCGTTHTWQDGDGADQTNFYENERNEKGTWYKPSLWARCGLVRRRSINSLLACLDTLGADVVLLVLFLIYTAVTLAELVVVIPVNADSNGTGVLDTNVMAVFASLQIMFMTLFLLERFVKLAAVDNYSQVNKIARAWFVGEMIAALANLTIHAIILNLSLTSFTNISKTMGLIISGNVMKVLVLVLKQRSIRDIIHMLQYLRMEKITTLSTPDRAVSILHGIKSKYGLSDKDSIQIEWLIQVIASRKLYAGMLQLPGSADMGFQEVDAETRDWLIGTYSNVVSPGEASVAGGAHGDIGSVNSVGGGGCVDGRRSRFNSGEVAYGGLSPLPWGNSGNGGMLSDLSYFGGIDGDGDDGTDRSDVDVVNEEQNVLSGEGGCLGGEIQMPELNTAARLLRELTTPQQAVAKDENEYVIQHQQEEQRDRARSSSSSLSFQTFPYDETALDSPRRSLTSGSGSNKQQKSSSVMDVPFSLSPPVDNNPPSNFNDVSGIVNNRKGNCNMADNSRNPESVHVSGVIESNSINDSPPLPPPPPRNINTVNNMKGERPTSPLARLQSSDIFGNNIINNNYRALNIGSPRNHTYRSRSRHSINSLSSICSTGAGVADSELAILPVLAARPHDARPMDYLEQLRRPDAYATSTTDGDAINGAISGTGNSVREEVHIMPEGAKDSKLHASSLPFTGSVERKQAPTTPTSAPTAAPIATQTQQQLQSHGQNQPQHWPVSVPRTLLARERLIAQEQQQQPQQSKGPGSRILRVGSFYLKRSDKDKNPANEARDSINNNNSDGIGLGLQKFNQFSLPASASEPPTSTSAGRRYSLGNTNSNARAVTGGMCGVDFTAIKQICSEVDFNNSGSERDMHGNAHGLQSVDEPLPLTNRNSNNNSDSNINMLHSIALGKQRGMGANNLANNLASTLAKLAEQQQQKQEERAQENYGANDNYATKYNYAPAAAADANTCAENENDDHDDDATTTASGQQEASSLAQLNGLAADDLARLNASLDDWDFDVFELDRLTDGRPLSFVMAGVFMKHDIYSIFYNEEIALRFFVRVEDHYNVENTYHNRIHAADVVQTTHHLLTHKILRETISNLDLFGLLVAAGIHDMAHTGTNNNFLVQTRDPLALLYNDRSVLENMHVALAFETMRERDGRCDILSCLMPSMNTGSVAGGAGTVPGSSASSVGGGGGLLKAQTNCYAEIRETIIQLVLGTDMKHHFATVELFTTQILQSEAFAQSVDTAAATGGGGGGGDKNGSGTNGGSGERKSERRGSGGTTTPGRHHLRQHVRDRSVMSMSALDLSRSVSLGAGTTAAGGGGGVSGQLFSNPPDGGGSGGGIGSALESILNDSVTMAPLPSLEVRRTITKMTLHCADVSNPAKPTALCQQWAALVQEEFFRQGDLEKREGITPVTMFMDRTRPAFRKCQLGFIKVIVQPLFSAYGSFLTSLKPTVDKCMASNMKHWQRRDMGMSSSQSVEESTGHQGGGGQQPQANGGGAGRRSSSVVGTGSAVWSPSLSPPYLSRGMSEGLRVQEGSEQHVTQGSASATLSPRGRRQSAFAMKPMLLKTLSARNNHGQSISRSMLLNGHGRGGIDVNGTGGSGDIRNPNPNPNNPNPIHPNPNPSGTSIDRRKLYMRASPAFGPLSSPPSSPSSLLLSSMTASNSRSPRGNGTYRPSSLSTTTNSTNEAGVDGAMGGLGFDNEVGGVGGDTATTSGWINKSSAEVGGGGDGGRMGSRNKKGNGGGWSSLNIGDNMAVGSDGNEFLHHVNLSEQQ